MQLEKEVEDEHQQVLDLREVNEEQKREAVRAEGELRARIKDLEEAVAGLKNELQLTKDDRDAVTLTLQRHDLEAERARNEAQEREHSLESDLVAERGRSADLGRANAELSRKLLDATAEAQRVQAELRAATELTEKRWSALQASREEIVKLEAARSLMREQLMGQIDEGEARCAAAQHRADQAEADLGNSQVLCAHLQKQVNGLQLELEGEIKSRNQLRWDAESSTGLLRGQVYDLQAELADVIAHVEQLQGDQLALSQARLVEMQHLQKRSKDVEADRERMRTQLLEQQVRSFARNFEILRTSRAAMRLSGELLEPS